LPFILKIALEYAIRKAEEKQEGLELNGPQMSAYVCAGNVKLLEPSSNFTYHQV
jgi:hypothetical protein